MTATPTYGRVLIVAGSDSGGGAGIQADIKAVTALGGYAMTAITALTAQNTLGVHGVQPTPLDFIAQQIDVVVDDLGVDCVKTGMLATTEVIETVADRLDAKGEAEVQPARRAARATGDARRCRGCPPRSSVPPDSQHGYHRPLRCAGGE